MGHAGSGNLTEEKSEKLREIGFRLAPSYDEMYERLAAARAGARSAGVIGPPEVDEGEDGELFEWVKEQKKMLARHSKGKPIPLSDDWIGKLISLGLVSGGQGKDADGAGSELRENTKWNAMFAALVNYKQERGTVQFPNDRKSLPKSEQKIKNWIGHQRRLVPGLAQVDGRGGQDAVDAVGEDRVHARRARRGADADCVRPSPPAEGRAAP